MTPYMIIGPALAPVELPALKAHLNVDHDDDDAKIVDKAAEAVGYLDGWGGLLGRCIMRQTWDVQFTGPGPHMLPFPDAGEITATIDGVDAAVTVQLSGIGTCVTVESAETDQEVTIRAVYAMQEPALATARGLVKLMVERDYDGLSGPDYDACTRTIEASISRLRWRRT